MRKFIFCLLVLFSTFVPAYSEEDSAVSGPVFMVAPAFSYSHGSLYEILHSNEYGKVSELEWNKNIFLYGAQAEVLFGKFSFFADFFSGIPLKSGVMSDSDWLNTDDREMKTTYSTGINHAKMNFDSDAGFSFSFFERRIKNTFFIKLSAQTQIQYSFDSFKREKAEGWYGQKEYSSDGKNHWWYEKEAQYFPQTYWSEEQNRFVTKKLAGISYERHSLFSWAGINAEFGNDKKISGSIKILLSPFAYINATDTHHGSETAYKQIQYGAFAGLKLGTELKWQITKKIFAKAEYTLLLSSLKNGLYYKNGTFDSTLKTSAKEKRNRITLSVGISTARNYELRNQN